jgi:hypothetical protein
MPLLAERRATRQNDYRAVTGLPDYRRVTVFSAVITGRGWPGTTRCCRAGNGSEYQDEGPVTTKALIPQPELRKSGTGMCQRLDRGSQPDPQPRRFIANCCSVYGGDTRFPAAEPRDGSLPVSQNLLEKRSARRERRSVSSPSSPLPTRPPSAVAASSPSRHSDAMLLLLGDKAELSLPSLGAAHVWTRSLRVEEISLAPSSPFPRLCLFLPFFLS